MGEALAMPCMGETSESPVTHHYVCEYCASGVWEDCEIDCPDGRCTTSCCAGDG